MRGDITFNAAGTSYRLRIGWRAMRQYEEMTGRNVLAAIQSLENPAAGGVMFADTVTTLFFCSLSPQPADVDAAADLMDELGGKRAVDLIGEAAEAAFDDPDADDEQPEKTKAATKKKNPPA